MLFVFVFQTIIFNAFLFIGVVAAKMEASELKEGSSELVFSKTQYKKVQWLNESEFTLGGNLYDLKEMYKDGDKTILVCKMDLKEKDVLEKLVEFFKHTKNKKSISFSFLLGLNKSNELLTYQFKKEVFHHKEYTSSFPIKTCLDKIAPPPRA